MGDDQWVGTQYEGLVEEILLDVTRRLPAIRDGVLGNLPLYAEAGHPVTPALVIEALGCSLRHEIDDILTAATRGLHRAGGAGGGWA